MEESVWNLSTWTHVVVTAEGATMKLFKDGVLVGTKIDGHEPLIMMRSQHWLGGSSFEAADKFEGSIAFVRVWHGAALGEGDVETLYNERAIH